MLSYISCSSSSIFRRLGVVGSVAIFTASREVKKAIFSRSSLGIPSAFRLTRMSSFP